MKTPRLLAVIGSCILAINSGSLNASDLVTYQGKLSDAASAPLPDGQYRLGVRIWDAESGGEVPIWSRKYDVPVIGGLFSVMMGSTGVAWDDPEPLTSSLKLALAGTSRFVEISVMSDAGQAEKPAGEWLVLAPRQALGSVPFALNGVPPGTVVPFAGTVIPAGWLLCDGTQYATNDRRFAALFATIQTSFGSEAGTFRVPDLRGRVAVGAGQGSGTSNRLLAQIFGAETHTLTVTEMPSHSHGVNDPGHSHSYQRAVGGGKADNASGGNPYAGNVWDNTSHNGTGISIQAQGGGQPHNNMQPSIVLNYIIKL